MIALTLPDGSDQWIERFAHGVAAAASRFGVAFAGGNLARGPLNIGVSVHGHVARGDALTRAGARPNDLVCVSGQLGGAAAALSRADLSSPPALSTLLAVTADDPRYPLRRYYLPEPRIELGRALRGLATAAIDISDGLVADLGHLCAASAVAGEIDLENVPVVAGVDRQLAATGGDDYELCFTIAPHDRNRLPRFRDGGGAHRRRCRRRRQIARSAGRSCRNEASAISAEPKGRIVARDLKNPFVLLAAGLGSGLAPVAPGTVGSLLALPIWWFVFADLPVAAQLALVAGITLVSIWVVDRACRAANVGDASAFVLDEFVGQWVALIAAPKSLLAVVVGFALFRAFDVVKPWPVSWADRRLRGGLGVVVDDVLAGVLAAVVLQLSLG